FIGWRPERTPLDLPLVAFVAIALLSDAVSRYGPPDLESATLWRAAIGFWIVFQGVRLAPEPERRAVQLLGAALAGLCLAAVVGLLQYWTGLDVVHAL